MLKEVLIVEGKCDTAAIKRAVEADTIETSGYALASSTIEKIRNAYEKRGIIIFTDPDGAGERIRKYLTQMFPNAGQAFVPKIDATAHNDVGIEQASPEAIKMALAKVRFHEFEPKNEFSTKDLFKNALSGSEEAALRREKLGAILGIGYANAKQLLKRLNTYGVTRSEFELALTKIDK